MVDKCLVIIPTYNEKENVERMVRKVFSLKTDFHLLIIEDNSPDGTADIIKKLQSEFAEKLHMIERKGKLGLGTAYITGFEWAVNVVNWPLGRVLMSYFASMYVRIVTGMNVHDTTAGFVCWKREVLETIDLDKIKLIGYGFQIEMKFTAYKFGFNIKEVSIVFTDRQEGTSKMSGGIFNEALWGVLKMKLHSFRRKYERKN